MALLDITRILFALIAVLGLIGVFSIIARRIGITSGSLMATRQKRLQLVDTVGLDPKRRLAIIRCDDREHLIILGPNGETVIDQNIPENPVMDAEPQSTIHQSNPFAERLAAQIKNMSTKAQTTDIKPSKAA